MIYENLFLYPHRFVHMEEESAAIEAVNNLNGRSVKGRPIKVEKSELKYPRKPSAKPGFSNNTRGLASALKTDGSTRHSPGYCDLRAEKRTTTTTSKDKMKLYVGNIGDDGKITSADLRPLFEQYGTVTECECIKNYA